MRRAVYGKPPTTFCWYSTAYAAGCVPFFSFLYFYLQQGGGDTKDCSTISYKDNMHAQKHLKTKLVVFHKDISLPGKITTTVIVKNNKNMMHIFTQGEWTHQLCGASQCRLQPHGA